MEELKQRYKMLPLWARLLLATVLGLAPAAYIYFDEGDTLQTQLGEAQTQQEQAREKFEAARKKKANLPKLEEQKDFTEQQLLKAKKSLPDSFRIEDVLQKTATIAKQSNIKLSLFEPGKEVQHRESYQYVELPIATEIEGRFGQLAAFFDKVVHLEGSIFLRRLVLTRVETNEREDGEVAANAADGDRNKSAFQKAKDARAKMRVHAKFDLVVYRGLTDKELAEAPAPDAGDGKGKGKGAPGAPGAPAAPGAPGAAPPPDAPPPPGAAPAAAAGPVSQRARRPGEGGGKRRL